MPVVEVKMTRICSIRHHINHEYVHEVYEVTKCDHCGWRRKPQTVTTGMFTFIYPNKCLKTPLKKHGLRVIRNINILLLLRKI